MDIKIEESWKNLLIDEFDKEYFQNLISFIKNEYTSHKSIYPHPKNILAAFENTPVEETKVVILGQDPYHTPGVANGLAFSVNLDKKIPPSLQNIFKELKDDVGIEKMHGDLSGWAKQGVLLLNSTLTVEKGKAGSHQKKGWEQFTDEAIKRLAEYKTNLVFLLWGKYAQEKASFVRETDHLIIKSAHPSPFSAHRGFLGSKPFSKTNEYLSEKGLGEIEW